MAKRNITLKLEDRLISRIKHLTVDEDTSVSAWVSALIEKALRDRDEYEASRKAALEELERPLSLGGKIYSRDEIHRR